MLLQFIFNGLITGLLYALLAMAFSLSYSATKNFHLAYAALIVGGAYIYYTFVQLLGFNWLISAVLSLIISGLLNAIIESLIYQPLEKRRLSPNSILLVSIGLFIILTNLIAILFGNEVKAISDDLQPGFKFGNYILTHMQIVQVVVGIIAVVALLIISKYSKLGILLKAISFDNILFSVFGHNAKKFRILLYAVSGALSAIVSMLIASDVGFDPYFGMSLFLNALVVIIFGGVGSFKGSLTGGLILGVLQSLSVYFFESRWETTITFLLLIIILVLRPHGLFGAKQRLI